jgi:thioredoxin reductase (NADPH)
MKLNRRNFISASAGLAATMSSPMVFGASRPKVVVIGGGDSALEEATFLTKFASNVSIIHRRDEFRASKIMQERALNNPKIDVVWNSVIEDMLGNPSNGGLTGVALKDTTSGETRELACDGAFVAIGHLPNSDLFRGQLELDDKGYINTQADSTCTSVPAAVTA